MYAIRNYDHGVASGYVIGDRGPLTFTNKKAAIAEADKMNRLPHYKGRVYIAEEIKD